MSVQDEIIQKVSDKYGLKISIEFAETIVFDLGFIVRHDGKIIMEKYYQMDIGYEYFLGSYENDIMKLCESISESKCKCKCHHK